VSERTAGAHRIAEPPSRRVAELPNGRAAERSSGRAAGRPSGRAAEPPPSHRRAAESHCRAATENRRAELPVRAQAAAPSSRGRQAGKLPNEPRRRATTLINEILHDAEAVSKDTDE
jgi:hypothetical protein